MVLVDLKCLRDGSPNKCQYTIRWSDYHTQAVWYADGCERAGLGWREPMIAVVENTDAGVSARVYPALISNTHPLASVHGSFNAVFVEGVSVGELMFYGRGAGGLPTASAVLGDVIDAAQNLAKSTHASLGSIGRSRIRPIDELSSAFYVNLEVADEPGVLAAVAGVFGGHGVSIRSMEQEGLDDQARLVFITHEASESAVRATLKELAALDSVQRVNSVLRVIGREG